MKDFVVYTAITNDYDRLCDAHALWSHDADFVAFLDSPQSASGWDIRRIYNRFSDPCRNAKIHKILSHKYFPKARYSLWIDGSIRIKSTTLLKCWPEKYLQKHDLAVFKHRFRECAYLEAAVCSQKRLDSFGIINRQMQKYLTERYPFNHGLGECTVLFRRHTDKIKRFNEAWYAEIKSHSRRDQLSFNYAAYKADVEYNHLPGNIVNNSHFELLPHTGPRQ